MKILSAWDFVKQLKSTTGIQDPWTAEDWSDFYHAIESATDKIARRHGWLPKSEALEKELSEQHRICVTEEVPL